MLEPQSNLVRDEYVVVEVESLNGIREVWVILEEVEEVIHIEFYFFHEVEHTVESTECELSDWERSSGEVSSSYDSGWTCSRPRSFTSNKARSMKSPGKEIKLISCQFWKPLVLIWISCKAEITNLDVEK